MSDLARRPRGGWQVGTRILGRSDVAAPAMDEWYTVERQPGVRIVRHFTKRRPTVPCCVQETRLVPEDDRRDGVDPWINALARLAPCARETSNV